MLIWKNYTDQTLKKGIKVAPKLEQSLLKSNLISWWKIVFKISQGIKS